MIDFNNKTNNDIIRLCLFDMYHNTNDTRENNVKKLIHAINAALAATIPGYTEKPDHEKFNIFMLFTFHLSHDFSDVNNILGAYFYDVLKEAREND